MGKNRAAITKYSGNSVYYKEVDVYGGQTTDNWTDLGYIESVVIKDTTDVEDVQDMTGNTVRSLPNKRVVKLELLLMQTDKTTIDFLKEDCRNKYYSIMIEQGNVAEQRQEIYFAICKIRPQVELASGVKRLPVEITVLNNPYPVYFALYGQFIPYDPIALNEFIYTTGGLVFKCTTAGTTSGTEPTTRENQTNGTAVLEFLGEYNYPSCHYQTLSQGDSLGTVASGQYYLISQV